ncbi:MAG: hypothetical protein D6694_10965 [Gammaproteobacteria bacterium]|nr:MAG: hypothetical protein D6694_10965 [Gammaproteobacteria bacterium]
MTEKNHDARHLQEAIENFSCLPKDIYFENIVQYIYGVDVIPFDVKNKELYELMKKISCAMKNVCLDIKKKPLYRQRPNEIGNAIEPFVIAALKNVGLNADIPHTQTGKKKYAGYPDIRIEGDPAPVYLEVKTYNLKTVGSTQRSFYFSTPHDERDKKVTEDAFHLLVGFAMEQNEDGYTPISYKIYDLYGLRCSLKAEFQSNNKQLYEEDRLLWEWTVDSENGPREVR